MHSYPGQQFARGLYAGMSERFKEPVLKTGAGKLAVGSNPTSGAIAPCEQLPSYLRAEFAITLPKPAALVFNGKHTSLPSWGCRFESGTLLQPPILLGGISLYWDNTVAGVVPFISGCVGTGRQLGLKILW